MSYKINVRAWPLFDQADVARPRPFLGFLVVEFDALPLAKQFEHRSTHRAAMEEVLEAGFIPDEPEPLVDKESCDRSGRHTRILRFRVPENVQELPHPQIPVVSDNEARTWPVPGSEGGNRPQV